jgi:hypothetical protein
LTMETHNDEPIDCTHPEVEIEELEQIIAPALTSNHNETLLAEPNDVELEIEELEQIIAPALTSNHNETLVSDQSR